jgi:hypothetical protein
MVRPANFGFNIQTAKSNKFQAQNSMENTSQLALTDFDSMVHLLQREDVDVRVLQDTEEPLKPDAIFPNNWVSIHPDGHTFFYPMEAENRRLERRTDVFQQLDFWNLELFTDFSSFETQGVFLEGTGSVIFDHKESKAYCAISSRSDVTLFEKLCKIMKFAPISFAAHDLNGHEIYHTNVLLSIGDHLIVLCSACVSDPIERSMLLAELKKTKRNIIDISFQQLTHFAGNCLEVYDKKGQPKFVLSKTAFDSLNENQISLIEQKVSIISVSIPTIEKLGGGSARCMLLGVF